MSRIHSGRIFYAGLLEALTQVMGSAKGYLMDHGPRVALLSAQLGDALGLSKREISELLFASILSDMGMVGLAEDAWENPVPYLPPDVRARVKMHPLRSEERVALVPHLGTLAPLVRHHHEWWDGSGYPDSLSGAAIPVGAQILRLADTVAALSLPRPHRSALGRDAIREIVEAGVGREFGPEVARTYLALDGAGEVPDFDPKAFRHAVTRAAEHLLPEEVSPLSSDHLLSILANLIDAKDPYTAGHSRRVATLAVAVAGELGLQAHMKTTLWAGGYLHDLGKLRVPLRILAKTGRLTNDEFRQVQAHPSDGAAVLETIPSLRHLTTGARYHHERWDGHGYPEGLRGDHIPLVGQILAVCDSYDAMTSRRAYRDSLSHAEAVEEVGRCSGEHFSPRVAAAFLSLPVGAFHDALIAGMRDAPFVQGAPVFRSPAARAASHAARAV
ncbi:MAG TPA: HD domain-containing phosphohydrolase [Longimicrobiales bacterium]|nr:HD domain-containing phosphohydrolase [Longimicrobiales bacterium]